MRFLLERNGNREAWSWLSGGRLFVVFEGIFANSLFGSRLFKMQSNQYVMMTEIIALFYFDSKYVLRWTKNNKLFRKYTLMNSAGFQCLQGTSFYDFISLP